MYNLLVILFAVLDCKVWDIKQLVLWADRIIVRSAHPKAWLINISTSGSLEESLAVIRNAMKEFGVLLPDNVGDLMAGLILLRFDNREIPAEAVRHHLFDIIDSYGMSYIDVEATEELDLNNEVYSEIRKIAEQAMAHLKSEQLVDCAL